MYMLTTLGEPQSKTSCSGWEGDPESFSKRVAEHYVRTVLGQSISARRIVPYYPSGNKRFMEVQFSPTLAVGVSFVKIPDYVIALRLRVQPPGPPRYYAYSCTPKGDLVLSERPKPTVPHSPTTLRMRGPFEEVQLNDGWLGELPTPPCGTPDGPWGFGEPALAADRKADLVFDRFEFGLSLVPAAHKPAIDALADRIVTNARRMGGALGTVRLVGHTDFIDTEKYNQALGLMRAKAVRGALATALDARLRGVTSRIEIIPESGGELQPVTTDKSAAARERNRRVEVFVSLNSPAPLPPHKIPGVTEPWSKYTLQDKPQPPRQPEPSEIDKEIQVILNTKIPPLPRKCVNLYDWVVQKLRRLLSRLLQKTPIPRRFHTRIQELAEKRARGLRDDWIERGLEEMGLEARFRPTARQLIVYAIQQACI